MKVVLIFIAFCFSYAVFSQEATYTVTNLEMNDKNPHFGLAYSNDGKVLITSFKTNKKGRIITDGPDPVLGLYEGNVSANGEITNIEAFKIADSEDIQHIVSATYSPDGKKLYVSTKYGKRKNAPKGKFKDTNLHIEVAELTISGWSGFEVLSFCKPKFSYAHPTLSADGKYMFFISDMKGTGKQYTKGKSDIYRVEMLSDGTFSEPENVGPNVNSYALEMFPFMSKDNVLFFSSNKPGGLGSYDIYSAKMNPDGTFEKAERLPKPINSTESDISFMLTGTNTGYLTSKRKKGKGDDDIYYVEKQ
ncbi:hypothetical protein Q2T40_12715 [Winogradskyella maritima]|uniref:WD40 repeat protein n=1 Tax=Winogradskyella maritima TaxID=1517766 RepID=A0ABV8AH14_9FLAO|nr:hypothetical protein [Winogradskyella maritima]